MCEIEQMPLPEKLRHVKLRLRGVMNGVVSHSMREKGLAYKVNFGVELPRLREMAGELPHTASLAAALWKEDIRECRLLATLLMPAGGFGEDLAELWVEQMRYPEEAECAVVHLFASLPFASTKAFEWIAADGQMKRLCGWLLLGRLLMQGARMSDRDSDELLDQAAGEIKGHDLSLRKAAYLTLLRYMETGDREQARGERLLASLGM